MVDLVRQPRMFAAVQSAPIEGLPVLRRWTLNRSSGRLDETILDGIIAVPVGATG
jgi:hypothetical protein